MSSASLDRPQLTAGIPRKRVLGKPVPAEGENGLFSQSWFPICLSREVGPGQVRGEEFLGGHVVAFRGTNGVAQVLSAYCPHLGADLSVGDVQGDTIRCAFHHWQYDQDGVCVKTGIGDPPPPGACLFKFPTAEKHGIIWAFNGEEPSFTIPDFPYPADELALKAEVYEQLFPLDPWVLCCNTPDIQHLKVLHGVTFDHDDPDEEIEWTDHSMLYDFKGHLPGGERIEFWIGIFGTTIFYQHSTINGRWYGWMAPFGLPRPGMTKVFAVIAARKADSDEASTAEFLNYVLDVEMAILSQDLPVLQTIHFKPGTLTKNDKALGKFLQYLRNYPRVHPSAEFIV